MSLKVGLPGERYGRLVVKGEAEPYVSPKGDKKRRVDCICDCGGEHTVAVAELRSGHTKSCGCLHLEVAKARIEAHRPPKHDLLGRVFGRLTVIGSAESAKRGVHWLCRCECGTEKPVSAKVLVAGTTVSCGCYGRTRELIHGGTSRHANNGRRYSGEWLAWRNMRYRCYKPTDAHYADYGGRGIKVCDRWRESFENFLEDMGPKPPEPDPDAPRSAFSIQRKDNDGDYTPENCCWDNNPGQANNTRANRRVEWNGDMITIKQLAKIHNIKYTTLHRRITKGCPKEFWFRRGRPCSYQRLEARVVLNGMELTLAEAAAELGIHYSTALKRYNAGLDIRTGR